MGSEFYQTYLTSVRVAYFGRADMDYLSSYLSPKLEFLMKLPEQQ